MSFEEIEHALSDAEAVQKYEQVKAEKAAVEASYQQYREDAASREQFYLKKISDLEGKLGQADNLTVRYNKTGYSRKEFAKLVSDHVEKEHRAAINREVNAKWTAEAPRLVKEATRKEIMNYPNNCEPETRNAIKSEAAIDADSILRNRYSWPIWFQNLYQQEVNNGVQNGLDKAFNDRVDQKATEEIRRRESIAWPKFIREKVTPQFQGSLVEQLRKLNMTLRVTCDRCGTPQDLPIGPDLIALLITQPAISISCCNPSCRGLVFHHSYQLTLGQLILVLIGSA